MLVQPAHGRDPDRPRLSHDRRRRALVLRPPDVVPGRWLPVRRPELLRVRLPQAHTAAATSGKLPPELTRTTVRPAGPSVASDCSSAWQSAAQPITTSPKPFCSKPLQLCEMAPHRPMFAFGHLRRKSGLGASFSRGIELDIVGVAMSADKRDPRDDEPDEAPETPLDEPRPPRVQDPPSQPDPKGPYVVTRHR